MSSPTNTGRFGALFARFATAIGLRKRRNTVPRFRTAFAEVKGTHARLLARPEFYDFLRRHAAGDWGITTQREQFENELALAQVELGKVPREGVEVISRFRIRRRRWRVFRKSYPVLVRSWFRRTRPQTPHPAATDIIVGRL